MWEGVHGHDRVVELFRTAVARGRLASTFLLVGPAGVGKRRFADRLARALLCERPAAGESLVACGGCTSCQLFEAGTHPDFWVVQKPKDKSEIPVKLFKGGDDIPQEACLRYQMSLKPFRGGRKIAIIDDADFLNEEGANCLLKTLEEPPPHALLILVGTSEQRQLPTIRSRSQCIRFGPLSAAVVAEILHEQGLVESAADAREAAELSGGSVQRAMQLADAELREFRSLLLGELEKPDFANIELAKSLTAFVEAAGAKSATDGDDDEASDAGEPEEAAGKKKSSPARPKRERLKLLANFAADFYRQLLRSRQGLSLEGDGPLLAGAAAAARNARIDNEAIVRLIERCLEVERHVEANAGRPAICDCWLDDLARLTRSGR